MKSVLTRKLENAGHLSEDDVRRLSEVVSEPHRIGAHEDIIRHGDQPKDVQLILEGFACRYKILPEGQRAIMALLLPGDFCDLHVAILGHMDHGIATLTEATVVHIPRDTIEDLLENHRRIARALWWATLVDEAILREWLVNMGQRRADRKLAHLLCELHMRLHAVGELDGFYLPLTQEQLADALGITPVHAQRVIAGLRQKGLISVQDRRITIPDIEALRSFAEFNPDYLHLDRSRRESPHRA